MPEEKFKGQLDTHCNQRNKWINFSSSEDVLNKAMERMYRLLYKSMPYQKQFIEELLTKKSEPLTHCQGVAQGNLNANQERLCFLIKRRWPPGIWPYESGNMSSHFSSATASLYDLGWVTSTLSANSGMNVEWGNLKALPALPSYNFFILKQDLSDSGQPLVLESLVTKADSLASPRLNESDSGDGALEGGFFQGSHGFLILISLRATAVRYSLGRKRVEKISQHLDSSHVPHTM